MLGVTSLLFLSFPNRKMQDSINFPSHISSINSYKNIVTLISNENNLTYLFDFKSSGRTKNISLIHGRYICAG